MEVEVRRHMGGSPYSIDITDIKISYLLGRGTSWVKCAILTIPQAEELKEKLEKAIMEAKG